MRFPRGPTRNSERTKLYRKCCLRKSRAGNAGAALLLTRSEQEVGRVLVEVSDMNAFDNKLIVVGEVDMNIARLLGHQGLNVGISIDVSPSGKVEFVDTSPVIGSRVLT